MARVPQYQPDVQLQPGFRQPLQVRADPNAFGAPVGEAMGNAGAGLSNLGQSLQNVQDLEDANRAKDALVALNKAVIDKQYGDGGYMTLEGRSAVDAWPKWQQEIDGLRRQYGQNLTGSAAQAYSRASNALLLDVYRSGLLHKGEQNKQWFSDSSNAYLDTFASSAIANYGDPKLVDKSIAAGQAELRQRAAMLGWDGATLRDQEAQYVSGVQKSVALRMAENDPIAAQAYIDAHKSELTGQDQYDLATKLKPAILNEQSKQGAADWFSHQAGGSISAQFNDAASMIKGFEGFRTGAYWDVNHYRAGYGSDTITKEDGTVVPVTADTTITQADAERDLDRRIRDAEALGTATVGNDAWDGLSGPARAAVTSVIYNYGRVPDSVAAAVKAGDPAQIASAISALGDDNGGVNRGRRNKEAAAVLGGSVGAAYDSPSAGATVSNSASVGAAPVAPAAAGAAPQAQWNFTSLESYLASRYGDNPDLLDLTRKRIVAGEQAQNAALEARQKQAKANAFVHIESGGSPDDLPIEQRSLIGAEGMSSLWTYYEAKAGGAHAASDPELLYSMRLAAAENPDAFSKIDLNDYRNRLAPDDLKELTGLQTAAIGDMRTAKQKGPNLAAAFSQAGAALDGAGLSLTGLQGDARMKMAKRIATFQNVLYDQISAWSTAHDGHDPSHEDVQAIINRLLLPAVLKRNGGALDEPGIIPNPFSTAGAFFSDAFGVGQQDGFVFEAGERPDGSTIDLDVKYEDIPFDLRRSIAADLETKLGYKPSNGQVTADYNKTMLEELRNGQ